MGFVHSLVETVTTGETPCGLLKIVECGRIDEKQQLVIITTREVLTHEPTRIRHISRLSHFVTGVGATFNFGNTSGFTGT